MNIYFLTCARYPTEKAYGVTVGNTMLSLTKLGIKNSIVTWGDQQSDGYGNKILRLTKNPIRIPVQLYNSNVAIFSKSAYLMNQLIFAIYFFKESKKFNRGSIYFWTREPVTLLIHSLMHRGSNYLIELHHSIGKFTYFVIKCLAKQNNVQIIVLTGEAKKSFSKIFADLKVHRLAMAVSLEFTKVKRTINQKHFVVGYLGKGFSNGHDNDLVEMINACKQLDIEKDIKFIFIGLESQYRAKLEKNMERLNIKKERVSFINHLEHSRVPEELAKFDVGIIPYPESIYNSERFPLKALEYAALGIPIIASDTLAHRNLLDESFTLFYGLSDSGGLASRILEIRNDSGRQSSMSHNARKFSKRYTYDERARNLLKLMEEVS